MSKSHSRAIGNALIAGLAAALMVWGIISLFPYFEPEIAKGQLDEFIFTLGWWVATGYYIGFRANRPQ